MQLFCPPQQEPRNRGGKNHNDDDQQAPGEPLLSDILFRLFRDPKQFPEQFFQAGHERSDPLDRVPPVFGISQDKIQEEPDGYHFHSSYHDSALTPRERWNEGGIPPSRFPGYCRSIRLRFLSSSDKSPHEDPTSHPSVP